MTRLLTTYYINLLFVSMSEKIKTTELKVLKCARVTFDKTSHDTALLHVKVVCEVPSDPFLSLLRKYHLEKAYLLVNSWNRLFGSGPYESPCCLVAYCLQINKHFYIINNSENIVPPNR